MPVKMSIHQALSTLKVLDARINKASNERFVAIKKGESQTIEGINVNKVEEEMKSNLIKVNQLISNRKVLRAAIVKSNANTIININGLNLVVADAIERKANLYQEQNLLRILKKQYQEAKEEIDTDEKENLPRKLEAYLTSILGNSSDRKPEDIKAHSEDFMKKSTLKIVDPNKIADFIENYESELIEFSNSIDYKLSESNATTFIEVDYITV
ncbi:hypothetical protein LJC17_02155 [Acholeplasma sp. OttesenSCG-928-E16]|nr:hypothetical protein [Acholeplasma sp. OttesenSCG-928-E16]